MAEAVCNTCRATGVCEYKANVAGWLADNGMKTVPPIKSGVETEPPSAQLSQLRGITKDGIRKDCPYVPNKPKQLEEDKRNCA